jgi:cold shock CspA family protein
MKKKAGGRPHKYASKGETVQVRFADALQRKDYYALTTEQRVEYAVEHAKTLALRNKQ